MNNIKQDITDKLTQIKDSIKHNVAIYAGVGLIALSSCSDPTKTIVEYKGVIGKSRVYAEKTSRRHQGKGDSSYLMIEILADSTKIIYKDNNNDNNIDYLDIIPISQVGKWVPEKIISKDSELFIEANKHYHHLRDTIPVLNAASKKRDYDAKAKSDSVLAKKYFGK